MLNNIQLEVILKNANEDELIEFKDFIETELCERKEKQKQKNKAIQNFLDAFHELQELGVDIYAHNSWVEEIDFTFE